MTLVLINLTLAIDDIIRSCFGIEIWTWVTLDLDAQFWWNFVSETFDMVAKSDLIDFKLPFLWRRHLVPFFF